MLKHGSTIQWRRFWCPLGSTINCDAPGGFLRNPEDDVGRHINANVVTLVELWHRPGPMILCGEPGMGKSTELKGVQQLAESQASANEGCCLWLVFRELHDFADFRRKTVDTAQWHRWRERASSLTLVVDGVDEGLLRVPNFVNDLVGMLKSEPLERLKLVLVCRTAEWPVETGRGLLSLWKSGYENPVYELCPLRQVDANEAACARGCDAEVFRGAVWDRGVSGLAARPVTLFFLLDEFQRGAGLPATHRELYEIGIARLVREIDPVRAELQRRLRKTALGATDAQRERAAQRLAALLMLAGRSAISISDDLLRNHGADLMLREAEDDETEFGAVNEIALREAVESALFTSLGEQRFGFAHQTFAECLAAQHLRAMPLVQLRRLLCQQDSRGEHVVPQLAELSAWVAGYNLDFCRYLLRIEPEALLRSDVTRLNDGMKTQLVDALLAGAQREEIFDKDGFDRFLDGLAHTEIAAQLRPVLSDSAAGLIARRVALEMASHCRVVDLVDDLVSLVGDNAEPQVLRDRAAYALEKIVPEERVALFEPLAKGEVGRDPDDTIRGCAFKRLVPKHWKVRDALPYIGPLQRNNFYGSYYIFLEYQMVQHLEHEDVAPLLIWLRTREGYFDSLHPASNLAKGALRLGWTLLHRHEVLSAMVELFHAFTIKHHHHLLAFEKENDHPEPDASQRRIFTAAYLNHPPVKVDEVYWLTFDTKMLSCSADLGWVLDKLPEVPFDRRLVWVEIIARMAWNAEETAPFWDKLLQRIDEIPELAAKFDWLCEWDLDEPRARKAKADWLRRQREERKWAKWREDRKPRNLRPEIEEALRMVADGSGEAWYRLWQLLASDGAEHGSHQYRQNVVEYPGWTELTDEERALCQTGARAFLLHQAKNGERIGPNTNGAWSGRAAFSLCAGILKDDGELQRAVTGPWLETLLTHLASENELGVERFAQLYRIAPDETVDVMLREASEQALKQSHLFALRNAKQAWNPQISARVAAFLGSVESPGSEASGIDEIAAFDPPVAAACALRFLSKNRPSPTAYPIGLCHALVEALLHAIPEALPLVMEVMSGDDALERCVWATVINEQDRGRGRMLAAMSERELGELYLTLHRLFPITDDEPERNGIVTPRKSVEHIRGQLSSIIAARESEAACAELLRLADCLPSQATWLRWTYQNAVTNVRRNLWRPTRPDELKRMLRRPSTRLLNSDDDLLELVIESLGRLQTHLTGQMNPAAETLWHWDGAGEQRRNFRHKDEEALSNCIARWLATDIGLDAGIVANREVQPRRGTRTDVLVEALPHKVDGESGKLTTIIEVKGCWNSDLLTALKTQLVDGYLRPNRVRCGLYLVGWFVGPSLQGVKNYFRSNTLSEAAKELNSLAEPYFSKNSDVRVETVLLDCSLPVARVST